MSGGVVLLAARTARSQAYAQTLAVRGLRVQTVVLFGDSSHRAGQISGDIGKLISPTGSLPLPDLAVPLNASLCKIADEIIELSAVHINAPEILAIVQRLAAKLFIYSGYGSQLVGEALLKLGPPVLHVHAGWLPQFRGSTTIYYELLSHGYCSASALLLAKQIDEGPVVARKRYPAPPPGIDMDYLYEPAMRADLLCDVLEYYYRESKLPEPMVQSDEEAQTYYVIHPLLKHVAILANGIPYLK